MSKRAATTRIEPGQHSIDRARPQKRDGTVFIDWSVRLFDGALIRKRTQASTIQEARRRARSKADDLLATSNRSSQWKTTDLVTDYIKLTAKPEIKKRNLAPRTRTRYAEVLDLLIGECGVEARGHRHARSLAGLPLDALRDRRRMIDCLQEIATLHGPETARQARSVLSTYVLAQAELDDLIDADPIKGRSIDLSGGKEPVRTRGGVALTPDDHGRVIRYLLELDPAEGVAPPKRGTYSHEDRIAKRECAIRQMLVQAATGMRASEANRATWDMVISTDGGMMIRLPAEVTKGRRGRRQGRTVPVLVPEVTEYLLTRQNVVQQAHGTVQGIYIVGSPAKPRKAWDSSNATHQAASLYKQVATELKIEELKRERTHVWRTTLNEMLIDLPDHVRASLFGHTTKMANAHYTDAMNREVAPIFTAAQKRLKVVS